MKNCNLCKHCIIDKDDDTKAQKQNECSYALR